MIVAARLALVLVLAGAPATALAQHDHAHHAAADDASAFTASLGLVAATYDQMLYDGDYQGLVPGVRYAHGRYAAVLTVPLYRLVENGRTVYGAGDVSAMAHAAIIQRPGWRAGAGLHVTLPTGDDEQGLGMGHVMLMPSVWASARLDGVAIAGSLGYGRGLAGATTHAEHGGAWPIVDPMSISEIIASGGADLDVIAHLRVGLRVSTALVLRSSDVHRVTAGARAAWTTGRVETAFELQAGLAGDPFTVRGVLETALSF